VPAGDFDIDGGTTSIQIAGITLPATGTLIFVVLLVPGAPEQRQHRGLLPRPDRRGVRHDGVQPIGSVTNRAGRGRRVGHLTSFAGQRPDLIESADATASLVGPGQRDHPQQ
jgi:hypothetical protein